MKHGIERIISGTVEDIADWVRRKPLLTLVLVLLLLKSFPIIAMVLLLAIGIAVFMSAQQSDHLLIEVDPV
jgi:hypothetical protein